MKELKQSIVASAGILFAGIITIPLAGAMSGADISMWSALKMSVLFFIGRAVWFYCVLRWWDKLCKLVKTQSI